MSSEWGGCGARKLKSLPAPLGRSTSSRHWDGGWGITLLNLPRPWGCLREGEWGVWNTLRTLTNRSTVVGTSQGEQNSPKLLEGDWRRRGTCKEIIAHNSAAQCKIKGVVTPQARWRAPGERGWSCRLSQLTLCLLEYNEYKQSIGPAQLTCTTALLNTKHSNSFNSAPEPLEGVSSVKILPPPLFWHENKVTMFKSCFKQPRGREMNSFFLAQLIPQIEQAPQATCKVPTREVSIH